MDLDQQDSFFGSMQLAELICANDNRTEADHPNIERYCANVTANSWVGSKVVAEAEETAAVATDCPKTAIGICSSTSWLAQELVDSSEVGLRIEKLQLPQKEIVEN